jgi:hypothetical protein
LFQELVSMNRPRLWSVLAVAATLAVAVAKEAKPTSPWAVDRALAVSPSPAAEPALKYRLLPLTSELHEGNAVPIYLRLVHEQNDAARKYWTETPQKWNALPPESIPLDEARQFVKRMGNFYRQLELGARRRTAEWDYTLDEGDPIGILLPDAQNMRNYAPMMVLRVRLALAEGDFAAAAHHLQTLFAFSRHVARGPFLINSMVAIAIANQGGDAVADFIGRPDAPSLYWALADLPRPLIELRHALDVEYRMMELQFPELGELGRERDAALWDGVLRRFRTEVRRLIRYETEGGHAPRLPENTAPDDPATRSPDLPAARKFVAAARGLSAEQVEAMPAAQVLLLYIVGTYDRFRDDRFRAANLPLAQARPLLEAADRRLRDAPLSEGQALAHTMLPALDKVLQAQSRLERRLAALRAVEAVRLYAAAHDGRLPDRLDAITEVPVPDDPGTGKPFAYHLDGDTATLLSEVPGNPPPYSGLRYRVTIRKK